MLLLIILVLLTIIGFVICACDDHFWNTEIIELAGCILGVVNGVFAFVSILILICNLLTTPINQAKYEEYYNKLLYKVEHIDSFNKEEIISQVDQWNEDYRKNTYGKKSPWVGWFYTIDTSTTNLIELETINVD